GREIIGLCLDRLFEVRAADLLVELPERMDVDRRSVPEGVAGTEERGHRRSLVVGRAAAEVTIPLFDELERWSLPVRRLRGLYIQVVVDGDRREARSAVEPPVHH